MKLEKIALDQIIKDFFTPLKDQQNIEIIGSQATFFSEQAALQKDLPVLDKTLFHYCFPVPDYNKFCTYRIYKSNLASLSEEHNIPLNHHDALSDVRAYAELWLKHLGK